MALPYVSLVFGRTLEHNSQTLELTSLMAHDLIYIPLSVSRTERFQRCVWVVFHVKSFYCSNGKISILKRLPHLLRLCSQRYCDPRTPCLNSLMGFSLLCRRSCSLAGTNLIFLKASIKDGEGEHRVLGLRDDLPTLILQHLQSTNIYIYQKRNNSPSSWIMGFQGSRQPSIDPCRSRKSMSSPLASSLHRGERLLVWTNTSRPHRLVSPISKTWQSTAVF